MAGIKTAESGKSVIISPYGLEAVVTVSVFFSVSKVTSTFVVPSFKLKLT